MNLNYHRSSELKFLTSRFEEYTAKKNPFTAFIIIIENLPMLNSAYGDLGADDIMAGLCEKITVKIGLAHRVSDNVLALMLPEVSAEKNKTTINALKKLVSGFGLKKDNESAAHISFLAGFIEVKSSKESGEEIYTRLYAVACSESAHKDEKPASTRKNSRAEMALANQIYAALDSKRLQLAMQPIIEAKSGKLHNYECLLRIIDEEGRSHSAGSFIHIAEKMRIIENIDIYVLEAVFDKLEKDKNLKLSFNISNLTIGNPVWSKRFFERAKPQIAKRLTVEITETAAMLDLRSTAYFIATLQETGAQVALDDFGSGYTSFRQIRSLSLDYVKIDGSIIKDITNNHHNQLLVKSLLEFLKGLKLKTVAEFVDCGATAKFLIDAGVDYMQGNYFGVPEL